MWNSPRKVSFGAGLRREASLQEGDDHPVLGCGLVMNADGKASVAVAAKPLM